VTDRAWLSYEVGVAAMEALLAAEDVAAAVAAARRPVLRRTGAFQGFRPVLGPMLQKRKAAA
jgi:hypothetical protein